MTCEIGKLKSFVLDLIVKHKKKKVKKTPTTGFAFKKLFESITFIS